MIRIRYINVYLFCLYIITYYVYTLCVYYTLCIVYMCIYCDSLLFICIQDGCTALMWACTGTTEASAEVIRLLLGNGADPCSENQVGT